MTLISVDPGTVTCGVAVWELDKGLNIKDLYSFTIFIDSDIDLNKRMDKLYSIFNNIFSEIKPFQLAHESGFINRFRPQAFGPIYTTIYLIRQAFINTIGEYGLFSYPPKMVKAFVSTGSADKNDMFDAVKGLKEVESFLTGRETEHEIDAIAIGYTHINNIRMYPEILLI